MKLTWFGGTALRLYIGGEIIVVDPAAASADVDRGELLAGSSRVLSLAESGVVAEPATWRPKPAGRAIDEIQPIELLRFGETALLVAAPGESPLLVLGTGDLPPFGRWADGAVLVVLAAREALIADLAALLDVARPRVIALAADERTLDQAVEGLAAHLDGTALVSLEPGLALEV